MDSRRDLARRLESVADFRSPSPALEQYRTPPEIAAHLIHLADLQDDLRDGPVVDLGAGTGMLAIGAALRGGSPVLGLERDREALATAVENEAAIVPGSVEWIRADATSSPLAVTEAVVVTNPPFGAQRGNEGADRRFLEVASDCSRVSYSLHNAGSREFVESFAADHGGTVTHAFAVEFDVDRQFDFHEDDRRTIEAEAYRIEWA